MTKKNKNSWIIREAKSGDFDAIRKLYRVVWGHQRPIEYDRWKYSSFVRGASQISIATVNKDIVSVFMLAPISLGIGSDIVLGGVAMDVMSHPEYRGTTVFIEAGKYCVKKAEEQGFRVLYGFPNTNSFPGFVKRLNWDHSGDINHWVRPIKPSSYSRVPSILGPLADFGAYLLPSGKIGKFSIRVNSNPPEDLVSLLKPIKKSDKKCQIYRSENWFYSRYPATSHIDYEWVCAYKGDKILALGVWGMRNANWGHQQKGRAQVTELLGDNRDALIGIVATIIKRANEKKVMLLETITNDTKIEKVLKSCSFFKYGQIPLIIKGLGETELPANIHHHPNWRILGGDVDTF